jgi:hypothetical protein
MDCKTLGFFGIVFIIIVLVILIGIGIVNTTENEIACSKHKSSYVGIEATESGYVKCCNIRYVDHIRNDTCEVIKK